VDRRRRGNGNGRWDGAGEKEWLMGMGGRMGMVDGNRRGNGNRVEERGGKDYLLVFE